MLDTFLKDWLYWGEERRREFISSWLYTFFILGIVITLAAIAIGITFPPIRIASLLGILFGASCWVIWLLLLSWEDYIIKYYTPNSKKGGIK